MRKVREDALGMYIITDGYTFRPGDITGWAHCNEMSSKGISVGDTVNARHLSGSSVCIIKVGNGERCWGNDYAHEVEARMISCLGISIAPAEFDEAKEACGKLWDQLIEENGDDDLDGTDRMNLLLMCYNAGKEAANVK